MLWFCETDDKVGVGDAARNAKVKLMGDFVKPYNLLWKPLTVELVAIRDVILFCLDSGFFHGQIVSHSQVEIELIHGLKDCVDVNFFIAKEIQYLLSKHINFHCPYKC